METSPNLILTISSSDWSGVCVRRPHKFSLTFANFSHRICPGKELADALIFIGIATILSIYSIYKYKDAQGVVHEPKANYSTDAVRYVSMNYTFYAQINATNVFWIISVACLVNFPAISPSVLRRRAYCYLKTRKGVPRSHLRSRTPNSSKIYKQTRHGRTRHRVSAYTGGLYWTCGGRTICIFFGLLHNWVRSCPMFYREHTRFSVMCGGFIPNPARSTTHYSSQQRLDCSNEVFSLPISLLAKCFAVLVSVGVYCHCGVYYLTSTSERTFWGECGGRTDIGQDTMYRVHHHIVTHRYSSGMKLLGYRNLQCLCKSWNT